VTESTVTGHGRLVALGSNQVDSWCVLTWPGRRPDGHLEFHNSGDHPHMGDNTPSTIPTRGLLSKLGPGEDPNYGDDWTGILVEGNGEVDVFFHTDFIWAYIGQATARWAIYRNGSEVAATSQTDPRGGLHGWAPSGSVEIFALPVASGDVIEAYLLFTGPGSPPVMFFSSPKGTGSGYNRLSVDGFLSLTARASTIRLHGAVGAGL